MKIKLDNFLYYANLYAFYAKLLSNKQQEIADYYYNYNLTLQEISDQLGVSKAAISDGLNKATKKMDEFENKLSLFKKNAKLHDLITAIEQEHISDNVKKIAKKMREEV